MTELIKKTESQNFKLEGTDAAFVIRGKTGAFEMILPEMKQPDEIVPTHVVFLMAIALKLKDPQFCNELLVWFNGEVEKENQLITQEEKKLN